MAKLEVTWSSLISLKKEQVQNLPDDTAGVYRLSYVHEDKNVYVFYVGKSNNIKTDLLNILDGNTADNINFFLKLKTCYFKWVKLDGETERSAAQRQLYKFYQPTCNDKMPDGDDSITINVT
jgi:excinuclease UvrABC nuclease subunit